jgi:ABC-2 type transport system ATP-binding protein
MTATTTMTMPDAKRDDGVDIKCAGLTKVFKDFWMRPRVTAVDHINLEVQRGEVFGLLGPNGSGKSTTIKMILGLLHPTAGRIAVFGKRPEDVANKRMIGYLPEESYLYPFLNARETLDYYGRLFYQSGAQRRKRVDMLLEMVGLTAVQRRPVREYSKGMQRRIGLAQALINDPQLLILDEPTTGLDPIGTRQIKDLIISLSQRGKTIVLSSHLLGDVEDVCDRVAIMFGGKIREEGACRDLLVQQDTTTIETSVLDDQTITEIEQVLARRGKSIARVDHPRQRLEALFLDIVAKAESEGLATSGARGDGHIAGFLVDGEDEGDHLLDQLMSPQSAAAAPVAAQPQAEPTPVDDQVIDTLVSGADTEPDWSPKALADQTPDDEPEQVDHDVLDDLIGGDKK